MLRRRRYGVVEMVEGRLAAIHLRPWPKQSSIFEARYFGRWWHRHRQGDRMLLYYNQPCRHSNYLALHYALSTHDCRLATLQAGLAILDEIARIKRSDAIFCQATSLRISQRRCTAGVGSRWGAERPAARSSSGFMADTRSRLWVLCSPRPRPADPALAGTLNNAPAQDTVKSAGARRTTSFVPGPTPPFLAEPRR